MKPNRIIPPKHYKGAWPLGINTREIVRFCEGENWSYAYLKNGTRILCKWSENDERP